MKPSGTKYFVHSRLHRHATYGTLNPIGNQHILTDCMEISEELTCVRAFSALVVFLHRSPIGVPTKFSEARHVHVSHLIGVGTCLESSFSGVRWSPKLAPIAYRRKTCLFGTSYTAFSQAVRYTAHIGFNPHGLTKRQNANHRNGDSRQSDAEFSQRFAYH